MFIVQNPECLHYDKDEFLVVEVDEDYVQMSEFITKKLKNSRFENSRFENGHAFYEFTKEEVLLYYKDVIHMPLQNGKVRLLLQLAQV